MTNIWTDHNQYVADSFDSSAFVDAYDEWIAECDMGSAEYAQIARMTLNPALSAVQQLDNAALGLAGESGEVADHIKKHMYHGHELDVDHLVKELGDILWYVNQACDAMGIPLGEVMRRNNEKLLKRYPNGFSSEASKNRSD